MGIIKWGLALWLLGFALEGSFPSASGVLSSFSTYGHQKHVHEKCSFTRYPGLCLEALHDISTHGDVLSALVNKTIAETKLPSLDFATLSSQLGIEDFQRAPAVTGYCGKLMRMSLKRLYQSLSALKISPTRHKNDIQTWLSAALTFQQACRDSAETLINASGNRTDMGQIPQKMDHLSQLSSNALALVNRITRTPPKEVNITARRLSEENGFPGWVSGKDRKLLQSNTIRANAVVAKDGSGNFRTVSEAIQAATGNRFVIYVKAGVYKEKIHCKKDGITLIGDGKYATTIVGDDSVSGGASMPGSATLTISGDGFIARDIGFQNTAGPSAHQALALNIASDHSVLYRCSIAGYQDTLYALALRQFYRECDIYGTTDFIFGNAAAVFQNCNLVLRRSDGVIMANGRADPGQNTGFSLQKCTITASAGAKGEALLGRPWKRYSRSVVMQSSISGAIASKGWAEWPGAGDSTLKSLYFAEFANVGPGAAVSKRVRWPGFHLLGPEEAVKFTVGSFIAGGSWLPSTGVTFVSGLQ